MRNGGRRLRLVWAMSAALAIGCGGTAVRATGGAATRAKTSQRTAWRTNVPSLDDAHPAGVWALSYADDGALLATAGEQIKIWSHPDHRLVATLPGHKGGTFRVAFSPDAGSLASTGADGAMRLWSLATGTEVASAATAPGGTFALDFDPTGVRVAFAGPAGAVAVWDVAARRELCSTAPSPTNALATSVAFSRSSATFVTTDAELTARSWQVADCAHAADIANQRPVGTNAFRYAADGIHVAIATFGGVRVWNRETSGAVAFVPTREPFRVPANVAFRTADRLAFATVSARSNATSLDSAAIEVWQRTPDGGYQQTMSLPGGIAVDIHPTTGELAAGVGTRVAFHPFPAPDTPPAHLEVQTGHTVAVTSMAIAPDGDRLLTCDQQRNAVLWDLRSGRQLVHFPTAAQHVSFADGGRLAIVAGSDVRVWDVATVRLLNVFVASNEHAIHRLEGQPDGPFVTLTLIDGTFTRYHLLKGTPTGQANLGQLLSPLAVSRAGDRIATVQPGRAGATIGVMDVGSRRNHEIVLPGETTGTIGALALNDDGTQVAAVLGRGSGRERIEVFDTSSGASVFSMPASRLPDSLAFSRDGTELIANGSELAVWNLPHRTLAATVSQAGFAVPPAGRTVVTSPVRDVAISGDRDGALTLWELPTLRRLQTLRSAARPIEALALSPKGDAVIGVGAGGTVYRWQVGAAEFVSRLPVTAQAAVSWHPTRAELALASASAVTAVSPTTGAVIATLATPSADGSEPAVIHSLEHSRSGDRLMGASADAIYLWDRTSDGAHRTAPLASIDRSTFGLAKSERFLSATLSSDGATVIAGTGQTFALRAQPGAVYEWDVTTQQGRVLGRYPAGVVAVAVAPSGTMIAAASRDGVVTLRDQSATGAPARPVATLTAPATQVLQFSPDGTLLATAGLAGPVLLWDVARRETIGELPTTSWVTDLVFTPAGDRLWAAERDGRITVSDVRDVERLADLVVTGGGGFIAHTPRGDYWASPDALPAVAFRVAGRAMAFDQLDLFYNRPDVVMKALGFSDPRLERLYRTVRAQRRRTMGVAADAQLDLSRLPALRLTGTLPLSVTGDVLIVSATASSPGASLARVNVWVNGVPVFGQTGLALAAATDKTTEQGRHWSGRVGVPLVHGDNNIEVSVTTTDGAESLRDAFTVTRTGDADAPDLYVLAVGVSDYGNKEFDLRYAAKDAHDLARMFVDTGHQYRRVEVEVITDTDATRAAVLERGGALLNRARPQDAVVVFLAGHGVRDGAHRYHFATRDANMVKPEGTGLTFSDIEGLVGASASRRKLVLIDSCFAGELVEGAPPAASTATVERGQVVGRTRGVTRTNKAQLPRLVNNRALALGFADLHRGTGAAVVSSSAGLEFAFESDAWSNGAFTFSVIEGLRERHADSDADGVITVSELRDYVGVRVHELTAGKQTPVARRHNAREDFALHRRLAPTTVVDAQAPVSWDHAALSPDGRTAAVARDGWAGTVRLSDGAVVLTTALPAGAIHRLEFLPDGTHVAIAVAKVGAQLWDIDSNTLQTLGAPTPFNPNIVVSPSGNRVAVDFGTAPLRTAVYDVRSGAQLRVFAGSPEALAFTSDNQLVAFVGTTYNHSNAFTTWDVATGHKRAHPATSTLPQLSSATASVVFNADGSCIAAHHDGAVAVWDLATGKILMRVPTDKTWASLAFAGRELLAGAASDGAAHVWRVANGESTAWIAPDWRHRAVALSRDGTHLFAYGTGALRVWKLGPDSGTPLTR